MIHGIDESQQCREGSMSAPAQRISKPMAHGVNMQHWEVERGHGVLLLAHPLRDSVPYSIIQKTVQRIAFEFKFVKISVLFPEKMQDCLGVVGTSYYNVWLFLRLKETLLLNMSSLCSRVHLFTLQRLLLKPMYHSNPIQ